MTNRDPEVERQILQLVNAFDTFEVLAEFVKEELDGSRKVLDLQRACMVDALQQLTQKLLDDQFWRNYAHDSGKFSKQLHDSLRLIESIMRWRYAVPNNRPRKEDERDSLIHKLRKEGLTFGQIANKINGPKPRNALTRQSAQQAHTRYMARQKKLLTKYFTTVCYLQRFPDRAEKLLSEWLDCLQSERLV